MKTLLNSFKDGNTFLLEVPLPKLKAGNILIRTTTSLLSSGTERMLVEFSKANLISKALKQPERVKDVIQKAKADGIISTYESIKSKLEDAIPMGYSNVGIVVEIGQDVKDFKIGDRVISNGSHSEYVSVPQNLCAKIPIEVNDETAVFTILASIGLNGIRLAKPQFGETFLVSGLGIIGLLTAQLLKANGCRVLGIDPEKSKCTIANKLGIETYLLEKDSHPLEWCLTKTSNIGLDAVIITATTISNSPIELATKALRKRGRIILVGQTGLNLDRNQFYKKEISFQVSCSYGPGRYDPQYEEKGNDYPISYVRWTEKRNFEAVLNAMRDNYLNTEKLISKCFDFNKAVSAYEFLLNQSSSLGILLTYPEEEKKQQRRIIPLNNEPNIQSNILKKATKNLGNVSFIGAGNYAGKILIPAFAKAQANFITIASNNGVKPKLFGEKFKFLNASTDIEATINDKASNTIVISTRHDSHAELILKSIKKDKNVFVEKPLCLNIDQLCEIQKEFKNEKILMVGFNRRFSPFIKNLKNKLDNIEQPKAFIYTCNAGEIDNNHWTKNRDIGGGRLLGEACHFVDLLRFLASCKITSLDLLQTQENYPDTFSLNMRFEDGSIGTIHYFSNGSKSIPKERIEVFTAKTIFRIDNFRRIQSWGENSIKNKKSLRQNKGQIECVKAFLDSIKDNKPSPIPIEEIFEVHKWIFQIV